MKVPIGEYALIDLDAPTVRALESTRGGRIRWLVWCTYCRLWHRHGPGEGHREAHCRDQSSPYVRTGYNLAFGGKWYRKPRL